MRPPTAHLVGPLAALALAGLLLTSVAPVAARPTAGSAARGSGHDIDTSSKAEVRTAYRTRFKDNVDVPSGWIGSTVLCLAGTVSQEADTAVLEAVNFVRAMAGLDAITFGGTMSDKAQEAALLMDANDSLSHDPPPSWDCWTEAAADAAAHSNLTITTGTMDAGEAIELYMDDQGASNKVAGHRRWILRPEAKAFGVGMTDTVNALWVLGPTDTKRTDPGWVPWPTAGWFPAGLQPHGRWSIGGRAGADFSDARVTVRTTTGKRLDVQKYKPVTGYARPTLVFKVSGLERNGKYVASVRGVKGVPKGRHTWKVKLFG